MRRALLLFLFTALFIFTACGKDTAAPGATPTPTPVLAVADKTAEPSLSGNGGQNTVPPTETVPPEATEEAQKSSLYDPSIYVIEASGSWQQELEAGYYANYESEIYLHKIDSNNNRVVAGSYTGFCWINVTLDTTEFIQDMLKDVPLEVTFDAGGEAICDNLGIYLSAEDDKAWVDYTILDEDGNPLPLTRDTPVAKGSFVAVSKNVYLEAKARGAQGEKVDYSDTASGDEVDVNYVIHVEPDSMEQGAVRNVKIHLFGQGFSSVLEGTLTRLSGYPDDVAKYTTDAPYQQALNKHLGE